MLPPELTLLQPASSLGPVKVCGAVDFPTGWGSLHRQTSFRICSQLMVQPWSNLLHSGQCVTPGSFFLDSEVSLLSLEAPPCRYCGYMWKQSPSFIPSCLFPLSLWVLSKRSLSRQGIAVSRLVCFIFFLNWLVELDITETLRLSLQELNLTQ